MHKHTRKQNSHTYKINKFLKMSLNEEEKDSGAESHRFVCVHVLCLFYFTVYTVSPARLKP